MNSYDLFVHEFICFINSYMNSGVPRFQMLAFCSVIFITVDFPH